MSGQSVETTVDSELARFYLEHHLRHDDADSLLAQRIDNILNEVKPNPYDRGTLKQLSQRLSVDFAAIYFASTLYKRAANKQAQDAFHSFVKTLADPGIVSPRKERYALMRI